MIVLLDLNKTLAIGADSRFPMDYRLSVEAYRLDLVEMIRRETVVLVTARPAKYACRTLDRIYREARWLPTAAYFNEDGLPPHKLKPVICERWIFPRFGNERSAYFAIESNPLTRRAYADLEIVSVPYGPELRDRLRDRRLVVVGKV